MTIVDVTIVMVSRELIGYGICYVKGSALNTSRGHVGDGDDSLTPVCHSESRFIGAKNLGVGWYLRRRPCPEFLHCVQDDKWGMVAKGNGVFGMA